MVFAYQGIVVSVIYRTRINTRKIIFSVQGVDTDGNIVSRIVTRQIAFFAQDVFNIPIVDIYPIDVEAV